MKSFSFIEVLIGLLIVAFLLVVPILSYTTVKEVTFTVTEKERVVTQDSSYYLIFTEDKVYKNSDTIFFLKFNSSDVYSQLKVGETYTAKVNWVRIPFFSMYQNILEVK